MSEILYRTSTYMYNVMPSFREFPKGGTCSEQEFFVCVSIRSLGGLGMLLQEILAFGLPEIASGALSGTNLMLLLKYLYMYFSNRL